MLGLITISPLVLIQQFASAPPRIDVPGLRIDGAQSGWTDGTFALVPVSYANAQPSPLHTLASTTPSFDGTTLTLTQTWTAPTQDAVKAALNVYANTKQWALATGGYVLAFSGGPTIPFDTSIEGMALITGKVARLGQANPPSSFDWQSGPNTFATITGAQITAAGIKIADFVQATFDALATVFAGITGGSITTTSQVDGAAWPTPSGSA